MSEGLLTVLKFCLVALLYLFLARVVRVSAAEMREPAPAPDPPAAHRPAAAGRGRGPAPAGPADLHLRFVEPESRRGETVAVAGELTLGRAGGCGLVLADDTFVSQVHARVFHADGKHWVEDLGSTNGTFVDGQRVSAPVRVKRGALVQVGGTVLEVGR